MIIVNLMGGLGNQLFQYATGRNLASHLQTKLKLDHSFLEMESDGLYTKRDYELGVFNTVQDRAEAVDLRPFYRTKGNRILNYYRKLINEKSITRFNEKSFSYDNRIETIDGPSYLYGYWQSEKYFLSSRDLLLKEIVPKQGISKETQKVLTEILLEENPVSLHIRRGDYVNLEPANSWHGVIDVQYYREAVHQIQSKISNPRFFVFSDDITWVKANLRIPEVNYIEGLKNYEDLELMKNCRHHIIANSSFSWWGAWLSQGESPFIIAPKRWFKDESINTTDLIPASWLRL